VCACGWCKHRRPRHTQSLTHNTHTALEEVPSTMAPLSMRIGLRPCTEKASFRCREESQMDLASSSSLPAVAVFEGRLSRKKADHGRFEDPYKERVYCWISSSGVFCVFPTVVGNVARPVQVSFTILYIILGLSLFTIIAGLFYQLLRSLLCLFLCLSFYQLLRSLLCLSHCRGASPAPFRYCVCFCVRESRYRY